MKEGGKVVWLNSGNLEGPRVARREKKLGSLLGELLGVVIGSAVAVCILISVFGLTIALLRSLF